MQGRVLRRYVASGRIGGGMGWSIDPRLDIGQRRRKAGRQHYPWVALTDDLVEGLGAGCGQLTAREALEDQTVALIDVQLP